MKKLLFVLFAALAFVACEKEDDYAELGDLVELKDLQSYPYLTGNSGYVKLSQDEVTFDKEKGGTITIETVDAAFVLCMGTAVNIEGVGSIPNRDTKSYYQVNAPLYLLKYEDIKKIKVYEGFGCTVVRDGYRKFTITVKPNCDSDYDYDFNQITIGIQRIVKSETYGPIAGDGCSYFTIFLK